MTTRITTPTGITEAEARLIVQEISRLLDRVADLNERIDHLERKAPNVVGGKR